MLKRAILVLVLLLFTVSLASAKLYEIGNFEECSDYSFYVEISSLGEIYEGSYGLNHCETIRVDDSNHIWRCDCNDSLNLTLDTVAIIDDTYSISVLRVLKGTDYDFVESYNDDNLKIDVVSVGVPKDLATGKVIGINKDESLTKGKGLTNFGIIGLFVLVLILVIAFNFGTVMPWESKTTKAKKFHKQGQKAYKSGNNLKAKKYYYKAAKLRNK